ncbi:MAG: hypothetical protein J6Y36_00450 [Treponema sp.]|nr:hypothetical protein [Treponema sp.]
MKKVLTLLLSLTFFLGGIFAETPSEIITEIPEELCEARILFFTLIEKKFYFLYEENNEYFLYGGNLKAGPFNMIPGFMQISGENFVYSYEDDDENKYIVLNENELGPFQDIYYGRLLNELGMFFFCVKQDNLWYIFTQENKYGPFADKPNFIMWKTDGSICFSITENKYDYVYTDGQKRGPFRFVKNDAFLSEVETFCYSWCETEEDNYHICEDGIDSEPYAGVHICYSGKGKPYYIVRPLNDINKGYIKYDGNISAELDISSFPPFSFEAGIYNTASSVFVTNTIYYDIEQEDSRVYFLQEGQIKSEIRMWSEKNNDDNFIQPFYIKWISCPSGKFGPYSSVETMFFDEKGHSIWEARSSDLEKYGLFVDGKLIYESTERFAVFDFEMTENKFIFVTGNDFNKLNVNGEEYQYNDFSFFIKPHFTSNGNDYTFYTNEGFILCCDKKLYKATADDTNIYYIDDGKIKKIE